jgi:hypothetical protein
MKNKERNVELIENLASKLSLRRNADITADDVAYALFMLWEQPAGLEVLHDLLKVKIDFENAFILLMNFNFDEFQKIVCIEDKVFQPFFEYVNKDQEPMDFAWRLTHFHQGSLNDIPHLYMPDLNLRLDIRTGSCVRKNEYEMKVPLERLVEIREAMREVYGPGLPPILVN